MKNILFIILTILTSYSIAQEVSTKVLDLSSGKKLYLVIKSEGPDLKMCRIYTETGDVIHETAVNETYKHHIIYPENMFIYIRESIEKGYYKKPSNPSWEKIDIFHDNMRHTIINTDILEKKCFIGKAFFHFPKFINWDNLKLKMMDASHE